MFRFHHTIERDEFLQRCKTKCDHTAVFYASGQQPVGFFGIRQRVLTLRNGRQVATLYFGHVFIAPEFRGKALVQRVVVRCLIAFRLKHPLMPLYLWSNALTVRPYLLTARELKNYYPSPFEPMPQDVREVRDMLGEMYYGKDYDPRTGVVYKPMAYVAPLGLAISEDKAQDPHVHLFMTLNPGYTHGDGLLIIQPASMLNFMFYLNRRLTTLIRGQS